MTNPGASQVKTNSTGLSSALMFVCVDVVLMKAFSGAKVPNRTCKPEVGFLPVLCPLAQRTLLLALCTGKGCVHSRCLPVHVAQIPPIPAKKGVKKAP